MKIGKTKLPVLESEQFKRDRQKIFGENTMLHGSMVLPKEYSRFRWACNLTGQEYSVLITLMMANSFENEMAHEPTYISQAELGAQLGVSAGRICQIYDGLTKKEFTCPFCRLKIKGYIRKEKASFKDGRLQSDRVWTVGYKDVINHLAGHYNEYMAEFGSYEGQERFKRDRDTILAGAVTEKQKDAMLHARKFRGDGDF